MRTYSLLGTAMAVMLALAACNDGDASLDADADGDASPQVADTSAGTVESGAPADDAPSADAEVATGSSQTDPDALLGDAVATVNGQPIALADFQRQAFDTQRFYVEQGLDANTDEGQQQLLYLRKQVLDDMLNQVLIEQAATELGIEATEEEVAERMKAYTDEFGGEDALVESLAQDGSTLDDIAAMERSAIVGQKLLDHITSDVPETASFVHARHILCDTLEACQAALGRLEAGDTFDSVAQDVSADETSSARGGDLDWIARGMLPSSQLEDQIFLLQPGQRSSVVETDFGFHVIEVLERDENRQMSAEQRYTLREKILMEWLAERRAGAEIEIFVDDLRELATSQG